MNQSTSDAANHLPNNQLGSLLEARSGCPLRPIPFCFAPPCAWGGCGGRRGTCAPTGNGNASPRCAAARRCEWSDASRCWGDAVVDGGGGGDGLGAFPSDSGRAVFGEGSRGSGMVLLGHAISFHSMSCGRLTPSWSNGRLGVGQPQGECLFHSKGPLDPHEIRP
jgi:hypothetical protein